MMFGGFALVMTILIVPFAVNVFYDGPVGGIASALVWVVIASVTVLGFYLGYNGWGTEH